MVDPKLWQRHIKDSKDIFFRGNLDLFRAFEFSMSYSVFYDALVESQFRQASREIYGMDSAPGVAIYSFGAPARREMFGASDADVAVYRSGQSDKELQLRERMIRSLGYFNFTKVDTPVWGTINDIRRYMGTSVTEANQVMEAQFICGDVQLRDQVERLRVSLSNTDTIARNLVFQFFYFDQYFQKKESPDHLNLKYSPGGIRDFLFPMWYAQLRHGVEGDLRTTAMERGLVSLYEDGLLPLDEVTDILRYSSVIGFVRDEIMRLTPGDVDGKLNFQKAVELYQKRPHLFGSPQNIIQLVEEGRQRTSSAKSKVWDGLCQYFASTKSESWNIHFKRALTGDSSGLPLELEFDEVINTARIWKLDAVSAGNSTNYLQEISESDSWIVLASLLSCPYVSGKVIDSVIKRKGLEPGYEYLLEIAARNANLETTTLEFILADSSTEPRFKKPAIALGKVRGLW